MQQVKQKAKDCLGVIRQWLLPARSMNRQYWPVLIALVYVGTIYFLGGLRPDHLVLASLSLLSIYNEKTLFFLKYFFPFILTGVVYDSMRYYYWWGISGHIHVVEPYQLEKLLFGITDNNKILTPNEYFNIHINPWFDLLCGFAYIFFVAEYLLAAFALFFKKQFSLLKVFGWCFFVVNCMGFMTYYIYPAAPPWYVSQYGLGPARLDIHPTSAAAHRFDLILGTHFFDQMYGRGVDVYGAFPSLHVSYPFLVAWLAFKVKRFRIFAIAFYFLMCFSAVYLQHHYILDIILGTLYAIVALILVKTIQGQTTIFPKTLQFSNLKCALGNSDNFTTESKTTDN